MVMVQSNKHSESWFISCVYCSIVLSVWSIWLYITGISTKPMFSTNIPVYISYLRSCLLITVLCFIDGTGESSFCSYNLCNRRISWSVPCSGVKSCLVTVYSWNYKLVIFMLQVYCFLTFSPVRIRLQTMSTSTLEALRDKHLDTKTAPTYAISLHS